MRSDSRLTWYGTLAVLLVLLGFLAGYAFWYEPSSLRVVRRRIALPRSGAALNQLRIAVIADLHAGSPYIDRCKIETIVRLSNREKPDLVLLAGDFVSSDAFGRHQLSIERVAQLLKPLRARLGVYAVLGNHDRWSNALHIANVLERSGVTVLENRWVIVPDRGRNIYLAGIGDAATHGAKPKLALSGIPEGQPVLCLTHSPDVFPALPVACILTIAAHTHGGQVWLPLLGRPIMPSRYGRRYAAGLIREKGKTLFVSTGIGTTGVPIRLGVPPEVTILDIKA
ncbi:MAG: metallophosphoesterase [Alphaproteobacteria bacterium]|nr:metallophosphoesterase [Alphaproteobacteria bacterium]